MRGSVCFLMAIPMVLLAVCMGCGEGDGVERYKVTGTVMFDGEPLAEGDVVLDPVGGQGGSATAKIRDGKFETEVTAGKKRVRIRAPKETGKKDEYGEAIVEPLIPMKYNVNSELTVEVTPEGPNEFEFDIPGS